MKTAGASVINAPAAEPPILNRIRKINACLRKLSLNAAKNWHQNKGAKRRLSSNDVVMVSLLAPDSIIAQSALQPKPGDYGLREAAAWPVTSGSPECGEPATVL